MSSPETTKRGEINAAQRDLESALLTLRDHFKVAWTSSCFKSLKTLLRLARKSA